MKRIHRVVSLLFGAALVLIGVMLPSLASEQVPSPKPSEPRQAPKLPKLESPKLIPAALPEQCQAAQERSAQLRAELEATLSPQAKAAAEQYVAKPGPGVSPEKAWGDYAAAALLMGNLPVAAWAGLKAAEIHWSAETVTNAGIYLYHLGKLQEALQLLNCAYAMGYRSPYLLEALAVVHHKLGDVASARKEIQQAREMAADDRMVETEASFMTTGQPPPPEPPVRDPDGLDGAIRELEEHSQVALNLMKMQVDLIQQSLPDETHAGRKYEIEANLIAKLIQNVRDYAQKARAMPDPIRRRHMVNTVLAQCVSAYATISDTLLTFPDSIHSNGSALLFSADVLRLGAPILARESRRDAVGWVMYGAPGPALAQGANDEYRSGLDAAWKQLPSTCPRDDPKCVRANARFCGVWKSLYERWENDSRQRYNTAARNFDRVATRYVIQAENEYLQLRNYAVRQFKKMRFQKTPGVDMQEMTLKGINSALRPVYQKHLSPATTNTMGTVAFVRGRAEWFQGQRNFMDESLASEDKKMQQRCQPAIRALLELLAEEEWQAYLDHLKDRLAWDVQPQSEEEFPCEGSIGPVTVGTDVNKLGSGKEKFDLKWKRGGLSASGSATLGGDKGVSFSGGASGTVGGVGIGVNTAGESSVSLPGVSYGPFSGKAKITLTTNKNPWNSQEYTGIQLKGSAGLGLKAEKLPGEPGVTCYPSSGSVTFYPRALYEDAVKYLSTPSSPPPAGRPR